ncbi:small ribosomal subunit biogenesis GTPase RsgA [Roseofilum sp. BLCC_M154]|uniref:Small ribosomal subunit biogenesis GTPase RsgA n=1 Tax=Roseofilum acuticapitatum BLCC-M154 TaxID=3022444 RepID=A0ABT7ANE8_9CYAN|nr:small ribosomal subunit biogenesis GTPase RsgA [Roseofilum acuticapitatum]MDJ1168414.1 small ribosomal subunit biogenesis GTPase RsgA [Roseofilum acuticapitatum BLCC-M154]
MNQVWVGTVLAVQANFYRVQLDGESFTKPLLCTRRSRLKKIGQRVMVGDRVRVEDPDESGLRGAIAEVYPRTTELSRPPMANADQILLVFSVEQPTLDPYQLSRFLVKGESTQLKLCLCLNKSDLVSPQWQAEWHHRLGQWGYVPLFISMVSGQGLAQLAEQLAQRVTVVAGPSGVGKSSLINALIPDAHLRVGEVSGKLQKGRHTTRHVELFQLPNGGLLADTPGFNQPDVDYPPEELGDYFPEVRQLLRGNSCQFSDCWHREEPHCAIRGDWERYEHYLMFLEEAIARQDQRDRQADPESTLKRKGDNTYEPKLNTKKYRRPSRRTQHQQLEEWYKDADL